MDLSFDLEKIIDLRHSLHKFPELANNEVNTSARIVDFLTQYKSFEIIEGIGGNGMACIIKGKMDGPSVLFRCDMDALPINELNTFDYASKEKGVSHKCGHDGHMAIMAGLADLFSKKPPLKGQVILLFQPAEETGEGALRIINDPKFKKLNIDYAFALHNLPGFKKGSIVLKDEVFSSASKGIIIKLTGKTSHAAEPENGNSPAIPMSNIVKELTLLPIENKFSDFTLVTVVYSRLGEVAFGTSPGYAEIMATLRAYTNDDMQILTERAEAIAKENSFRFNLKLEISHTEEFPAAVNNNDLVEALRKIAIKNNMETESLKDPLRWSEDFAHFTQKFPGVIFGLGSGENHPQLHRADYDFPDDIISKGVGIFHAISEYFVNIS